MRYGNSLPLFMLYYGNANYQRRKLSILPHEFYPW